MKKLGAEANNTIEENIKKIKGIFPEVFNEDKIDFEKLQFILGEYLDINVEKYNFSWPGKSKAIKIAQTSSTGTLRPCKLESKEWNNTKNIYIEGDNLEVLKLLQKSYNASIKMIYIDPPYNTGSDFVYKDDFKDNIDKYLELTNQKNSNGNKISNNTESNGRYHSNWLNMMYPRLRLARNLLKNDGVIAISIDDNEIDNLKKVCNEIFNEENYIATFPWRKRTAKSDVPFGVSQDYEWIVLYAKSKDFKARIEGKPRKYYTSDDYPNRPWRIHDMTKQTTASERPNSYFTMINPKNGDEYPADPNRTWRITKDTFQKYYDAGEIVFPGDYDFLKISKPQARYFKDKDIEKDGKDFGKVSVSTNLPEMVGMSLNGTKEIKDIFGNLLFPFPKPISLIKYFINIINDSNSIILDFFSGSATTAHAVMQLNSEDHGNRKFIMIQLPEKIDEKSEAYKAGYKNICEIGKERIKRAGDKIKEENKDKEGIEDLDTGFKVFKLDSSNIKRWDSSYEQDLEENLFSSVDNIKEGRTAEDILYEILLKYGVDLNAPIEEHDIAEKKVFDIGFGAIIACLDKNITLDVVEGIGKLKEKLNPETCRVVFMDNGFSSDSVKTNAVQILKRFNIEDVKSI